MPSLKGSTLPETNIFAPENGWLGRRSFPFGAILAYFSGANSLAVSFRECICVSSGDTLPETNIAMENPPV